MPKPSTLKKYLRIVKLLQDSPQKQYPLLSIKEHLKDHGFANVSDRTLLRDFDTLRDEFGIPLEYSPKHKGWFINSNVDHDLEDSRLFIKLLEFAERVETVQQHIHQTTTASRAVLFEHRESFKGSHHLSGLIKSIEAKTIIEFTYKPYDKDTESKYRVEPYLITEYSNRWYLVAWDLNAGKLKTFGLDRMENITNGGLYFSKDRGINFKTLYENTYGVTLLDKEPEFVVLSFTPKQGKYINSLPLHTSQRVIVDSPEEFRVELRVIITYELKKEILSFGDSVKVLEPLTLRDDVVNTLKNTLKNYSL